MTAIYGLFSTRAQPSADDAGVMAGALQHYGRDWLEREYGEGAVLGACRAAMLPTDRAVPETRPDERYIVVADARLSRPDELRASLPHVTVADISDAEIVRLAVNAWGEEAFDRLSGEFAVAAWDRQDKRLLLARDVVGARPLFYHESAQGFAFASMPEALHALPWVDQKADRSSYRRFLRLLNPGFAKSFFEGVYRVMPGHYLLCDQDGIQQLRYWNPNLSTLELADQKDYEDELERLLDDSVSDALRGTDGDVASELSSGYDSTAVTTSAALQLSLSGRRVVAFTAAPQEDAMPPLPPHLCGDESLIAGKIAAHHPNIDHVVLRRDRHMMANADRSASIYPAPYLNLCNAAWCDAINDAVKERGFSVLLIGSMGNTTISESGTFALPELFRKGQLIRWASIARGLVANRTMRWRGVIWNSIAPLIPDRVHAIIGSLLGKDDAAIDDYLLLSTDEHGAIDAEIRAENARLHPMLRQELSSSGRLRKSALEYRLQGLAGDQGAFHKATWAEWGIDTRDPTADRRLIEFALRVPVERLIWKGQSRAILTAVLSKRVPDGLLDPRRKGVQSADWAAAMCEAKSEILSNIDRATISGRASGLISEGKMEELAANWPEDGSARWHEATTIAQYRYGLLRALSAVNHFNRANATNY